MMLLSELVNDVVICQNHEDTAHADRVSAEEILINALAMNLTPLLVGGTVVIGDKIFNRPYNFGRLEITDIVNVPANTVVQS